MVDDGETPSAQEDDSTARNSEARRLHELVARFRHDQRNRYAGSSHRSESRHSPRPRTGRRGLVKRRHGLDRGPHPASGREHVARAIHYRRAEGVGADLIPLSCELLSADLLRSTVRALEQTAAGSDSSQNTLLLNEIDLVEKELQSELAAMLAEGFPMRVISTARTSVEKLLQSGDFREDLALALSTLTIDLPPAG